jgi:dipeptidase D
MNEAIRQLEPTALWQHFADLNAVPRPSKKEERVIQFIKSFGEGLNLPTSVDEVGNVLIKKPATKGLEDKATVVLQSHLDMVHQKNNDTDFDFDTQGIDMYVDGDWVRAKGTTLGADNGIGVASIMTLLASTTIPHPAIEALFTIDEETGMTGALAFKGGLLSGNIMLNLDTEEDNELTIGCAGGIDVTASGEYKAVPTKHTVAFRLTLKGLTGGHSGVDIHKGRGNANKLITRCILTLAQNTQIDIAMIDGGSLRNAIPREINVDFVVAQKNIEQVKSVVKRFQNVLKADHLDTDPNMSLTVESLDVVPKDVLPRLLQTKILKAISSCPNGVYRMNPDIEGMVQTSNNLSRVLVKDGVYSIQCLTRSSVDAEKTELQMAITAVFTTLGAKVTYGGAYPGWTPKPSSPIVKLMSDLYVERYGEAPIVSACHAGLECGILGTHYPDMQMISFGPTIHGAHSPDECVQISSVQKYWGYLLETLVRIPNN